MTRMNQIWNDESGVLTFEWILLITVVVIGITGGLSAVRDAYIDELGDTAEAMVSLDHSYWINAPLQASIYDELTFPVEDWISGSANASFASGEWEYFPSHYLDVKGEVTRFRVDKEAEGEGGTASVETTGQKPSQIVDAKSSVQAEGSTNPNFGGTN